MNLTNKLLSIVIFRFLRSADLTMGFKALSQLLYALGSSMASESSIVSSFMRRGARETCPDWFFEKIRLPRFEINAWERYVLGVWR